MSEALKASAGLVRAMVEHYYSKPGHSTGGGLHIVLDDNNLSDNSIEFCREWCSRQSCNPDHATWDVTPDHDGVLIATLMLQLDWDDRVRVLFGLDVFDDAPEYWRRIPYWGLEDSFLPEAYRSLPERERVR